MGSHIHPDHDQLKSDMNAFKFFDPRDPKTGWLCNFYRAEFRLDGRTWPTVEHACQAAKFTDAPYAEAIRFAETPRAAKTLGQSRQHAMHADWETQKRTAMLRLLAAKFCLGANTSLMARLLKIKGSLLIEASPADNYWGVEADGQGFNHLGRILMAVRGVFLHCNQVNLQMENLDDGSTLHVRVVGEAGRLLKDAQWNHA